MKNLTLLIIIFICLVAHSSSLQENTAFEMHETNSEEAQNAHKISKKSRNAEKQKFQLYDFFGSVKETFVSIQQLTLDFFNAFVLRKAKPAAKQSIVYRENFASQNGGAQILMVSSSKIKSPKAILRTDLDAYLFTADVLPITIIIALKEEILIDSFAIQSGEAYSCITNDFMLEGAFSLDNSEWMFMGNFTAQNSFQVQEFALQQKIIRYIRLTILSSYGKWKYFTLSQVKVYGEGLFSHAMESLLQTSYNISASESANGTENKTIPENIESMKIETNRKSQVKKFGGNKIQTKQLLVQAFEELVIEGKKDMARHMSQKALQNQTLDKQLQAQQFKLSEEQQIPQKSSTKDKKSISILKKKIQYLEKRNFELNRELKNLKTSLEQRLFELQTKGTNESAGQLQKNSKWYQTLMSSQTMVIISMIINISCMVLVGLVFKRKILSSRLSQSSHTSHFEGKDLKGQKSESSKQQQSNQDNTLAKNSKKQKVA